MFWLTVILALLPLACGICLLSLVWKLHRHGFRDRAGAYTLAAWMGCATVYAALTIVFPQAPDWLPWFSVAAAVTPGAVLLAVRVTRRPELLFEPATAARIRALRDRLRPER